MTDSFKSLHTFPRPAVELSDVAGTSVPVLIQFFDLFGTMAFAVTGAFKAIEHRADIVGVIFLATITGVAGGVMRDIILGRIPPSAVTNPLYLIITASTAVAIFFLFRSLRKHWDLFLKFDAIGLGVFTIIGATIAYNLRGLDFVSMAFAGLLTAVGGGILRDAFVNEVPIVFVKELYATASFLGVVLFFGLLEAKIAIDIATVVSIVVVIAIRLLAKRFNWNLPRPKSR